jgi:hypothetical protein
MPGKISRESALEFVKTEEYKSAQGKLNEMLARSATDMEFRQKLLTDPRAAFAEVGESIPEGVDLRFVENQADATIVLPDPLDRQAELSEAELEAVAGGIIIVVASSTGCAALAGVAVGYVLAQF